MSGDSSWYGDLGGAFSDGLQTVFKEGIPKYVDAEIEDQYEVEQPSRKYEVNPAGDAQRAGLMPKSTMSNPWVIGGAAVAAVVVGLVALKGS